MKIKTSLLEYLIGGAALGIVTYFLSESGQFGRRPRTDRGEVIILPVTLSGWANPIMEGVPFNVTAHVGAASDGNAYQFPLTLRKYDDPTKATVTITPITVPNAYTNGDFPFSVTVTRVGEENVSVSLFVSDRLEINGTELQVRTRLTSVAYLPTIDPNNT